MSDFEPPGGRPPSPPPPPPPSEEPPQPGWWKASDGNWYPPEQAPQQQAQVPPPPGQGDGQGYGPQDYRPYGGGPQTNGLATWSLGLGIASIVLFWAFGFGVLVGIVAVILGVMGLNKAKDIPGGLNAGQARAGLIMGVLGAIGGILFVVFLLVAAGDVVDDVQQEIDQNRDGECNPDSLLDPDC